jgi:hypothetical protein
VAHEFVGGDVEIYDISDLEAPVLASSIEGPPAGYTAHNPIVIGDLLYASWFEEGVRVYNIADPYNPSLVGSYDTYTGPYDEPGECAGFESGQQHPLYTDFAPYPVACGAWGIYPFLGNDQILVSDFDGGLFIVSLDDSPGGNSLTAASTSATPIDETLHADQVQPLLTESSAVLLASPVTGSAPGPEAIASVFLVGLAATPTPAPSAINDSVSNVTLVATVNVVIQTKVFIDPVMSSPGKSDDETDPNSDEWQPTPLSNGSVDGIFAELGAGQLEAVLEL